MVVTAPPGGGERPENVIGEDREAGGGIGREGGTWSFDFYSDVKNTVYAPRGWRSDG